MTAARTILIVDDSPVNRRILREILTRTGYRVLEAESGQACLDLYGRHQVDLILLDIMLPDRNGYEICRILGRQKDPDPAPVIFISALSQTGDIVDGFEAGGVDYITKPFQPAEVLARISTHLRLRALQQDLSRQNNLLIEEQKKTECVLCHVLPRRIAREIMRTGGCTPQRFDGVTVCFVDIVDFTTLSARMDPEVLIGELNRIFSGFDRIATASGCERIKTIGDAYLFAAGVPDPCGNHAERVARAALAMRDFIDADQGGGPGWLVRIGIHSGPVVGGVVGSEKYLYDIFGDTVNIAARMEELAAPMEITVSAATRSLLTPEFLVDTGRQVEIRGAGVQTIHTLGGVKQ